MSAPFPTVLFRIGPVAVSDTMVLSAALSLVLVVVLVALRHSRFADGLAAIYEVLERSVTEMVSIDPGWLLPLVLTLWIFIGAANLAGLLPGVPSPTRDLSLTAALASVAYLSGHINAFHERGIRYLRQYIEPSPFLLPFNLLGEISRTIALALRLFGNMLSGTLIAAIAVYLAGVLVPVPLMMLTVLTGVVQAYIFGVLALVFAASSLEAVDQTARRKKRSSEERSQSGGSA